MHADQAKGGASKADEDRFGQPAQTEAGHGDAQLGGAEVGGEILQDVPGQPRAAVPRHDQRLQLRVAQFDEGEFGGDEEAVDQDNGQDAQQPERVGGQKSRRSYR